MQFQQQVVRDLAWRCTSAPLLASLPDDSIHIWPQQHTQLIGNQLKELDQYPHQLLNELDQLKSTRLGLYYEALWRFYWQHYSAYQVLAHNLQITGHHHTLGAFDFLLRADTQCWHVETAVKFYLGVPGDDSSGSIDATASEWHQWVGPNCNDRLDIKMARLLEHQLPLSSTQAGQSALRALTADDGNWQNALLMQGYFFYPAHQSMPPPRHAHDQHQRGLWWYLQDFVNAPSTDDYWMILPRHQWLSTAQTDDINCLLSHDNLVDNVKHWVGEMHRPQLIAAMEKSGKTWKEKQRGFVVPDHWPWTATPSRNT